MLSAEIDLDRVARYMDEYHPNDRSFKTNPCLIFFPHSQLNANEPIQKDMWDMGYVKTYDELRAHMYEYLQWAISVKLGMRDNLDRLTIRKIIAWVWILGYEKLSNDIRLWYDTAYADSGLPAIHMICEEFGWTQLIQP